MILLAFVYEFRITEQVLHRVKLNSKCLQFHHHHHFKSSVVYDRYVRSRAGQSWVNCGSCMMNAFKGVIPLPPLYRCSRNCLEIIDDFSVEFFEYTNWCNSSKKVFLIVKIFKKCSYFMQLYKRKDSKNNLFILLTYRVSLFWKSCLVEFWSTRYIRAVHV